MTTPTESAGVDLPAPYAMATGFALYTADQMREMYQRGLAARPLPSDWVAVPREATDAMLSAWLTSSEKAGGKSGGDFAPWSRAIRCYRAMLAAAPSAPAASGGDDGPQHFDGHDHEGFPGGCERFGHSSKSCPAAASVSERARELLAAEYRKHGWHEDAGRLCMGGDPTSFVEDDALRVIDRLVEQGDEDAHVITELGRLLASIAVILKGPEPAGTAWSYHDLPSLVASEVAEPRQVAAEMKAWAHTKMAEQQSSRRDRMMVVEWAKRLLPESSFPVKDFHVEGMSITKEAARGAVKRVALEQALTQQRGDGEAVYQFRDAYGAWRDTTKAHYDIETSLDRRTLYTTPQPSADAVREDGNG